MSLRTRFIVWISTLVAAVVVGGGALQVVSERRLLVREMRAHQGETMKRLTRVCEESLYQKNLSFFNYLSTLESERGFRAAFFTDMRGVVQMHSDPGQIGHVFHASSEINGEPIVELTMPVQYAGTRVGTAWLLLSQRDLRHFLNASLRSAIQRIAFIMGISLLIGFFGAVMLGRTMVTPIQILISGLRRVSTGALEPIDFPDRSDELGWTYRELNATVAKLRELEDMKQNFFARVTHELRSPLTANQGFLMLLLRGRYGAFGQELRDLFLTMSNNLDRLSRLVDDLLTTSKIEKKKETLELSSFDLAELMTEVRDLYAPLAEQKGLALVCRWPTTPLLVRADYEKIVHVISNLISNALKYTNTGQVIVTVVPSDSAVQISVADTGIGIPAADRAQVFHPFYRSRNAKDIKGTGLGLSIVKSLVDLHGGELAVDGNPGGGTVFSVTLPRTLGR